MNVGNPRHENTVSGPVLCRHNRGILAKSADIWLSGRHVTDMSATFPAKLGATKRISSYSAEKKINGNSQHGHNHLGGIGVKVKNKPLGNQIGERGVYLDATIKLEVDFDDVGNILAGLLLVPLNVPT